MIRGEKNSASMDSRRGYGPGWQVDWSPHGYRPKIRHNECPRTTSANYYASHQALQDILLTEELFKLKPEYDEANRRATENDVCVAALFSSDETDMSLGQSLKGKRTYVYF